VADAVFSLSAWQKESILGGTTDAFGAGISGRPKKGAIFFKKMLLAVDARILAGYVADPPEAGLPGRKTRELVLACFWDCKLELNFVPGDDRMAARQWRGREMIAGERLSFFCGPEEA